MLLPAIASNLINCSLEANSESNISKWQPYDLFPHGEILSIFFTVLIIAIFVIIYYCLVRKVSADIAPTGYVLAVQLYMLAIRNFVVDLLGKRFERLTPFFLMLVSYIGVSNIIGVIGMSPPTSSLTVTFSLGLMMFFGMISVAFHYQRLSYLKSFFFTAKIKHKKIPFLPNPLALFGEITPLFSISIRLWGNIFAGAMLITMFYFFIDNVFSYVPIAIIGAILSSIFGGIFSIFIHFYFDIVVGVIQSIVFFMLTVLYWSIRKSDMEEQKNNKIVSINPSGVTHLVNTSTVSEYEIR